MNANFSLHPHEIHLWRVRLSDLIPLESDLLLTLSADEVQRVERYHFPIHKQRFAIARGILRRILSCYTGISPAEIEFEYGHRGKPFLKNNLFDLQFNVSHSHDMAIYAITKRYEIGVDIEMSEADYKEGIVQRFFSEAEYQELYQFPETERKEAFYRLWAAKEAFIKAIGEGLFVELNSFTIQVGERVQTIVFNYENIEKTIYVENFIANSGYQSAFATQQKVEKIVYWQWDLAGPVSLESF